LDDTEPEGEEEIHDGEDGSDHENEDGKLHRAQKTYGEPPRHSRYLIVSNSTGPNGMYMDVEDSTLVDSASHNVLTKTSQETSHLALLIPSLVSLAYPTPLSFPPASSASSPSLSVHPPTTSVLGTIHVRALECLNNIFIKMADDWEKANDGGNDREKPKSAKDVWGSVWNVLRAVGPSTSVELSDKRWEMWTVGVGVLWGLARVCKGVLVRGFLIVPILQNALLFGVSLIRL
jgi:hypothetical protein